MRVFPALSLVVVVGCATAPRVTPTPARDLLDPLDLVRALNDEPEGIEVYGRLATAEMLAAVPAEKFAETLSALHKAEGKRRLTKLRSREPDAAGGERIVVDVTYRSGAVFAFTLTLDPRGRLAGLLIQPSKPGGPADGYRAKIAYRLPVEGEWTVGNGGREAGQNLHVGNAQQWYAYDLLRTDAAGHSCPVDAKGVAPTNADCLAFGQIVVAPADGTVTFTADGIPDNAVPGEMDDYFVPGNAIGIDHGGGEFSFLCHLEPGTLHVHKGDHVTRGQPLAKVGNSGHSSEPHLHWHLATDPRMANGHGLPIRFGPLLVNGKLEAAPQPVQNDRVEQPK